MTIVQVYARTSAAKEENHDEYYDNIQDTIESTPKGDILIVMGDFNAKVGQALAQEPKYMAGKDLEAEMKQETD